MELLCCVTWLTHGTGFQLQQWLQSDLEYRLFHQNDAQVILFLIFLKFFSLSPCSKGRHFFCECNSMEEVFNEQADFLVFKFKQEDIGRNKGIAKSLSCFWSCNCADTNCCFLFQSPRYLNETCNHLLDCECVLNICTFLRRGRTPREAKSLLDAPMESREKLLCENGT